MNHDFAHARHIAILLIGLILFCMPAAGSAGELTPAWECWGPGLPDPCRNDLRDIAIVPGTDPAQAVAVGDGGTILHWNGSDWHRIASGVTEPLHAVAMSSPTQGWAVGRSGTILTWNGATWAATTWKTGDLLRAVALVPGTAPLQAWAAGDNKGVGEFILWNGTEWQDEFNEEYKLFGGGIYRIAMLDATSGWAVGGDQTGKGQIWRWDGSWPWQWQTVVRPEEVFYGLDMVSATDGWAVGEAGLAYRWNGTAWNPQPTPFTTDLRSVDMVSASAGWAAGEAGTLARWNGAQWQTYAGLTLSQDLTAVAMASAGNGWAVGEGGVILRWDGSDWQMVAGPAYSKLESVAATPGSSGMDGWAVGETRDLLHWNGSNWHPTKGPTTFYYAVSMVNDLDGWAAGPGGRMYRWNGVAWAETPRVESAKALGMIASDDGWAVGWGKIQHWDGTAWTQVASPTTRTLYGMDVLAANDIWAAGDGGTIIHTTGQGWALVPSPVKEWLTDVGMAAPGEGYIVGNAGTMLRWDGTAWHKMAVPSGVGLLRGVDVVRAGGATTGWAVGDAGRVLRLAGGAWSTAPSPTGNDLYDIALVSPDEAWAVGEHGVILHWGRLSQWPSQTYLPSVRR